MHRCRSCGSEWSCLNLLRCHFSDAEIRANRLQRCHFHVATGARRSLWTCPTCAGNEWANIRPLVRNQMVGEALPGVARPIPEGGRRCGCNKCSQLGW